jgi:hypothetical protein
MEQEVKILEEVDLKSIERRWSGQELSNLLMDHWISRISERLGNTQRPSLALNIFDDDAYDEFDDIPDMTFLQSDCEWVCKRLALGLKEEHFHMRAVLRTNCDCTVAENDPVHWCSDRVFVKFIVSLSIPY